MSSVSPGAHIHTHTHGYEFIYYYLLCGFVEKHFRKNFACQARKSACNGNTSCSCSAQCVCCQRFHQLSLSSQRMNFHNASFICNIVLLNKLCSSSESRQHCCIVLNPLPYVMVILIELTANVFQLFRVVCVNVYP